MKVFKALDKIDNSNKKSIFLAGSIDKRKGLNWRNEVIEFFKDRNFDIYDPQREDWDGTWKNDLTDTRFSEQTNWEMEAMKKAGLIIMNFLPQYSSSVSLLELGLFAASKKVMVCCPADFDKSGNVQFICNAYNIPSFKTIKDLLTNINF